MHPAKPTAGDHSDPARKRSTLRLVAWETTRNCNLSCVHCRASATNGPYKGELDTTACFKLLDQIALVDDPIIILTGGEPLLRPDIFDIAPIRNGQGAAHGSWHLTAPLVTKAGGGQNDGGRYPTHQYQSGRCH